MNRPSTRSARSSAHTLFEQVRHEVPVAVAIGIQAVVAVAILGPAGIVLAAVTAVGLVLAGTPYGLAAGHVALVGLDPSTLAVDSLAAVECAFFVVLAASFVRGPAASRVIAAAGVVLVAGGSVAWLTHGLLAEWATLAVAAFMFAPIYYGIYRYQLVRDRTGRRADEPTPTEAPDDPTA
ncbi:hypothetical protein C479_07668 [Halovivax asiaticus JCM 14624]|uniref:DUF8163 domain-containing protein n=1 Tax=Halovivax asiaticus JCM 14624 TaxID=1227490 RepID=M0BNH3_9EURY|nr:hypothetical protein [Halovivax asiaticus]ELZ11169.1 hypothetical protein C479_07668 [Halovivax asiaticus JCM 14624]